LISSYTRYVIAFFAALMLQAIFVPAIQIRGWKPDLVLIVLVIFALQHGKTAASTAGFFVGMMSDLLSWKLLGLGALTKTISGYVAAIVGKFLQDRNQFILTLFITGFIHDLFFYFIITLGKEIVWRVLIFAQIIPNLLYTAIIGIVINYFFGRWLAKNE